MPDPQESPADQIRDRIAARSQRMDARYPKALDLEASVTEALHRSLHGVASLTAGTHAPEHWREALRGQRPIQVADLCRLATEPGREGREAVRAAVRVLAEAVGLEVGPASGRDDRGLIVEAAEVATAASRLVLAVGEALADGGVEPQERAVLLDHAQAVKREVADVEAALNRAPLVAR